MSELFAKKIVCSIDFYEKYLFLNLYHVKELILYNELIVAILDSIVEFSF